MARRSRTEPPQPRCAVCRRAIVAAAVGRPPRFCTNACRQVAYRRRRDGERKRRLVALYQGDALEFLRGLPDESVDLVVTDPPYAFDRGEARFRDWHWPSLPDSAWAAVLCELYRVLGPNAHAYLLCDRRTEPIFDAAAKAAGFRVHQPLVWDKGSIGLGGIYRSQYEYVCLYEKGRRPGNFKNRGDVLQVPRVRRGYPTEKPVELLRQLISQSSVRGELVLDPFCGSGATGIAARELRRRALLCDVDACYAARRLRLAIERLEDAAA